MSLPALADHKWLRFGAFTLLYVAQGLPIGVFVVALPAWMATPEVGYSAGQIGTFLAVVFLPWSLKLVAGPVMDRFSYLPMGRRRPWVLAAQLGISSVWLLMALWPDLEGQFLVLMALGAAVNAFAAGQDVATDGMAIDVLPEAERARANAFMFGGQLGGLGAAGWAGSQALEHFGMPGLGLLMLAVTLLVSTVPLLLRERSGERLLPWTKGAALARSLTMRPGSVVGMGKDILRAILLPMSLVLVATDFIGRMGSGLTEVLLPVVTGQVLGWSATLYPSWTAPATAAAAALVILVAPFVDRGDARRAAMVVYLVLATFYCTLGLMEPSWADPWLISAIFMFNAVGLVASICVITLFMSLCSPRLAATQFAIYMALANLGKSVGSASIQVLGDLSYGQMFLLVAGCYLISASLVMQLDVGRYRRATGSGFAAAA